MSIERQVLSTSPSKMRIISTGIVVALLVFSTSTAYAQGWDADVGVISLEHACGSLTPQQAQQMLRVPMKLSRVEGKNEPNPGALDQFYYYPDGSSLLVAFQSGVCEVRQEWPPTALR